MRKVRQFAHHLFGHSFTEMRNVPKHFAKPTFKIAAVGVAGYYLYQATTNEEINTSEILEDSPGDSPSELHHSAVVFIWQHRMGENGSDSEPASIGHAAIMTRNPVNNELMYMSIRPKFGVTPASMFLPVTAMMVTNLQEDIDREGHNPDNILLVKDLNSQKMCEQMQWYLDISNAIQKDDQHEYKIHYELISHVHILQPLIESSSHGLMRRIMATDPFSETHCDHQTETTEHNMVTLNCTDLVIHVLNSGGNPITANMPWARTPTSTSEVLLNNPRTIDFADKAEGDQLMALASFSETKQSLSRYQ